MGAPRGSRNNPVGRPAKDPANRAVPLNVRLPPHIAAWVAATAKRRRVQVTRVVRDALSQAMGADEGDDAP